MILFTLPEGGQKSSARNLLCSLLFKVPYVDQ
jgi:hypothetical protein